MLKSGMGRTESDGLTVMFKNQVGDLFLTAQVHTCSLDTKRRELLSLLFGSDSRDDLLRLDQTLITRDDGVDNGTGTRRLLLET
jgi:hypothetical protein